MEKAQRVVLNTSYLYANLILSTIISLYATRLVLEALGVLNYGIFSLIAGVIAMLSFLNAAMTTSTQRYMSYYLGADNFQKLKSIFKTSVSIHLIIGIAIVLILEIASLFLFDGFLKIPEERIYTAKIVYQLMIASTFFTINSVPYDSSINAHENMSFVAISGIVHSLAKLGIAIGINYASSIDKLILYAGLMTATTILFRIVKSVYCYRKYTECTFNFFGRIDKSLFKEMFSFSGWNMFGALAGLARYQGLAIVLNLVFGAVINAAYGIANQITGQLRVFSLMILKSTNPQIMKSEGKNDRKRMLTLSMTASKFCFFLVSLFAIPIAFEMPSILSIWLKEVPEHTSVFSILLLSAMLINNLTVGLQSAAQAVGKIKLYQIIMGGLLILNLPFAYFLLKLGQPAYMVIVSLVVVEGISCVVRILLLKKLANMSVTRFLSRVFLKELTPLLSNLLACFIMIRFIDVEFRFIYTILVSITVYASTIYFFGLCKDEKHIINTIIESVLTKIGVKKRIKANA